MEGGEFPLFQSKPAEEAASDEVATRRATRLIERDIEAPEVFQVTEAGLWDGRPSLGGVWVAHPDVKDPERVLIRNTANDKFVIGALFRRERENPGPRFQVSSDAAAALGLLAGAPINLNVTALRREEVPQAPEALPSADKVEEQALDPIASAASAIDKAEGKKQPAAKATAPVAAAAAVATTATDSAVEMAGATPEPAKKETFFSKLFSKKKAAPAADAKEMASGVSTTTLSAPAVQSTPLNAMKPAVQAAPSAARVQPASAPAASAVKTARASGLSKPYLQIGIFSVEQNANNTATAMRQAGMIPTVRKQSSKGKKFWRVLIGPATSSADQAQLLKKVKSAGFTDAYAVTN
ncbi:SPOR domain-containing protein [Pseudooceanicola sp.]|uniref:SPOR domain-containing protein n=1 Tax=Pseudooceanicola sp. TaxID=1914328 RepID=UPI0026066F01|nr:SPOR domain-containing protein [Pseudooceanicola sp.]MDF1856284.1 SPOR domain-containing protein [Pseudooceanicola sp.]